MLFRQLYDSESSTYTYLLADLELKKAILIDPVLDRVDRDLKLLKELGLSLRYCLETHIHADHITGTGKLRELTGCLGIVPANAHADCANRHIQDEENLELGSIVVEAIATPGHTDSHMAYLVNGERVLTGDALFIRGCGRTDFQQASGTCALRRRVSSLQSGDAGTLYDSVTTRLFTLPDETLVYPAHDYRGQTVSTIGEEKQWNPRFAGRDRDNFIRFMNNLNLPDPKKMMEAVPANERCGRKLAAVE